METPGGGACPGFSVAISGGGILSDGGFTAISVAPLQKTHGGLLPTPFSSTNQDPLHLSLDNETYINIWFLYETFDMNFEIAYFQRIISKWPAFTI